MSCIIRRFGPAALILLASVAAAQAQGYPPPGTEPPRSQACVRLEAQLAALDRGISDPSANDQTRRYEDAVNKLQFDLDRTVAQSRRMGCESSGFFLFGRGQSPQCVELSNEIQRIRANLDRAISDLQRQQGGSADRGEQRRAILGALAVNDCGPQYRSAAPPRPRGFFETLFGAPAAPPADYAPYSTAPDTSQSSTYRTVCVRTCDGFYFPVSYSASPAKFRDDEQACQRMCPASEVMLFTYRNPGEDVAQAVSSSGQTYTSLPNAFRYRQEFNSACSCRRSGESWADTLRNIDDTAAERGDIIVTDENAKSLFQPKADARTPKQSARAGKSDPRNAAPAGVEASGTPAPVTSAPLSAPESAPPPAAPAARAAPADTGKKSIRTVGPPFIVR
jgi:hypothetical protein